jgi:hypothetical protein
LKGGKNAVKRFVLCLIGLAMLFGGTQVALSSTSMPLDGTWLVYDEVIDNGDFFSAGPWTWDSPSSVKFTITDLYVVTNWFGVYDGGAWVLDTPQLPDYADLGIGAFDSPPWTGDPDVALLEPRFSKAEILFGPGAHAIDVEEVRKPVGFIDGTLAIKAEVAVPEPGTILLIAGGLLGLSGFAWRRRKST